MNAQFAKDFINLQAEIQTMPKDKSGYGYKYTDLDTIISNLKPLLKSNNLAFMQMLESKDGTTGVKTIVLHNSGEVVESWVAIPDIQVGKANNAQNVGAAITYFKRYALAAVFGISSDEDVDCSDQIQQRNKEAAKNAAPSKSNTAPTIKAQTSNKSVNNSKNFTPEQGKAIANIVNQTAPNGEPYFNEEEKENFRQLLREGKYADAKDEAETVLKMRKMANLDNSDNSEVLF